MKKIFTTIIAIVLLTIMSFFAFKAYKSAKSYEEMSQVIFQKQNISELTTNRIKKFADTISLGLYHGYDKVIKENKKSKDIQLYFKDRAIDYTIYFMATLSLLLLLYFLTSLRDFTIISTIGGLISLTAGLFTPIMMITIHKEVEHIGDIILTMESKGVLGSIEKLFNNEDFVIATALLLFSILLPLFKSISILFVSIFINNRSAHTIVHLFKMIGKWSMADVFVVSTFLVYLSASRGDMSRAEIQVGIYFFLAYVIVSILASLSADKMLQENKQA